MIGNFMEYQIVIGDPKYVATTVCAMMGAGMEAAGRNIRSGEFWRQNRPSSGNGSIHAKRSKCEVITHGSDKLDTPNRSW